MKKIGKVRAGKNMTKAVEAFEGRVYVLRSGVIRHIGDEKQLRDIAVAAWQTRRYEQLGLGPNRVGSWTLNLKRVHA
tara:strand:- start:1710 stop:1940 length:231 start_codon:yes stop_codon:yes gene_type:complete